MRKMSPDDPRRVGWRILLVALLATLVGCSPGGQGGESSLSAPSNSDSAFRGLNIEAFRARLTQEANGPAIDPRAKDLRSTWTLEHKVASLFVVYVPGQDSNLLRQVLDEVPVGGFLLLASNLPGPIESDVSFANDLLELANPPLLISVDQEGGPVRRIFSDGLPAARELGEGPVELTRETFLARNTLVKQLGANVNFGVVADVSSGPDSFIDSRSFGTNPAEVARHVRAALQGSIPGVASTLKHFPGHGMTTEDSHLVVPRVEVNPKNWVVTHGLPFFLGVQERPDMVMLSHLVVAPVDTQPASLSRVWVDILRNDLGFSGVVVTDDLAMLEASGEEAFADPVANAVAALTAGADLLIHTDFGPAEDGSSHYRSLIAGVAAAVRAGAIDEATVDSAVDRVLTLRFSLGGVSGGVQDAGTSELTG